MAELNENKLRKHIRNTIILFKVFLSMVFPLALIAGPIRGIPFYWQLIDCSFGLLGLTVLYPCYKSILKLETIREKINK